MKLINVPFECLSSRVGYVIGANGVRGTIIGFSTELDGKHFQQLINIQWSCGRKATYNYPDSVHALTVDKSHHEYNLTSWINHNVNRLYRHIKFLKKSSIQLAPDNEYVFIE